VPDVVILFFVLGVIARLAGSHLKLPAPLYESLSVYLLLSIGIKGGAEIAHQPLALLWPQVLGCVLLGLSIPALVAPLLRRVGFAAVDSASIAAHYGSVSVVTFAVACTFLERTGVHYESHAALWLALMEAPALVTAALLAARAPGGASTDWRSLSRDVLAGPSVMLLAGGLAIGAALGPQGLLPLKPVFVDAFKGVLALFLLELGLVVGERLRDIRRYGPRLIGIGVVLPPLLACGGALLGWALGLSTGGVVLLATLAGSASYIAAPTAMRIALPQANPGLSITAALGITFPFNVVVGIPLYAWIVTHALGRG
jgi:hypothetical protein